MLANDLRKYEPDLVDSDAVLQLGEFKSRFNLDLNQSTMCTYLFISLLFLECDAVQNQELFDWVDKETSGLLMWICLVEGARELKAVAIEDLLN